MPTITKLISTGTEIGTKVIFSSREKGEIYKTDAFLYDSLPDILKVSVIYKISADNGYIVFTI